MLRALMEKVFSKQLGSAINYCGKIPPSGVLNSIDYLLSLKDTNGVQLIYHCRQTFVQGFIIAALFSQVLSIQLLTEKTPYFSIMQITNFVKSLGTTFFVYLMRKWFQQ